MKRFFKIFRGNVVLNSLVRTLLRGLYSKSSKLIKRWPVNGKVRVKVGRSRFLMYSLEDEPIANSLYYFGPDPELQVMHSLMEYLSNRIEKIFDVGANVGLFSLLAIAADDNVEVYAFEPHPANFKRLKKNIALNHAVRINPINTALGESNEDLKFYVPRDKISVVSSPVKEQTSYFESNVTEIKVKQSTLDEILFDLKIFPDLLKIDVELFEREVLRGGKRFLKEHAPLILIEIHNVEVKLQKLNISRQEFESYTMDIEGLLKANGYFVYGIFNSGIYKLDSIQHQPDLKNAVCAKVDSKQRFYNLGKIGDFVNEMLTERR